MNEVSLLEILFVAAIPFLMLIFFALLHRRFRKKNPAAGFGVAG